METTSKMSPLSPHIHHANLIVSKGDCRDFVLDILKRSLHFDFKANPDFWLLDNPSFGIDEARVLEKWAIGKPLLGEVKACLILTKSVTFEAQNALLKVLEEPVPGTYFFLCLESLGGILPTFLSRVRVLERAPQSPEKAEKADSEARRFIKSGIKERFHMVRSLSKKENKEDLLELLKELEAVSYGSYKKGEEGGMSASSMKAILAAKTFASVRGSSPKMLLEWLSCVL